MLFKMCLKKKKVPLDVQVTIYLEFRDPVSNSKTDGHAAV